MATEDVLAVKDLTMHYMTRQGPVYAVDEVSFNLGRGDSLGLVGESGCGKTSVAISLLKLLPENAEILLSQPNVDGALVGGASLKAETFLPIIKAAQKVAKT